MKNCVLTGDEVLYVAASFGADAFYGVPDRLSGLSDNALRIRVMELEDSLSAKGYAKRDFDGNINLDEKMTSVIMHCAECNSFICAEIEKAGEGQSGEFYFIKDDKTIKMFPDKENYNFEPVDRGQAVNTIIKDIEWKASSVEKKSFRISLKNLQKAQNLALRGAAGKARELLEDAGADDILLETVLEGISHKADYYSYLFLNVNDEMEPDLHVSFVQGTSLAAAAYIEQDNKDYIEFSLSTKEEQIQRIEAGIKKLSLDTAVDNFV